MGGKKQNSIKISISGIVQGVGFRPFVFNLATKKQLKGYVLNNSQGVEIILQCDESQVENFIEILTATAPPRSKIKDIKVEQSNNDKIYSDFSIRFSQQNNIISTEISPDLDVCPDCLRELFDKSNPRYLYPFINCTNCGPRFTITQNIPYDRKNTTMSSFNMCDFCQSEYNEPINRRFHAQPNGCHQCGPKLELMTNQSEQIFIGNDSITVEQIFDFITKKLQQGYIFAIKGIGGFHLVCDALNEKAVQTLRKRKYREDKPFAVMFSSTNEIKKYCNVTENEKELLEDFQHPIVLLKKHTDVAQSVAPGNHYLGCMLPYSPVHHILMHFYQSPLVMTSGNISDEPVKHKNIDALENLSEIADYFLMNNRDINIRCDDSVVRSYNNQPYFIRRSRGYTPTDLEIDHSFSTQILACGAEQKNVFALAKNDKIFMSHHIGDLKNYSVLQAFQQGINHFQNIFDIAPKLVAIDKHPDYLNHIFGKEYASEHNIPFIEVQHHHAHAASCMAENELDEKVIALVLDGTGYGDDAKIWGGECLVCDYHRYERVGHFREAKMPGGDFAIKNISAMGLAYLYEIFGSGVHNIELPFIEKIKNKNLTFEMLEKNINTPVTTSCGRLFDGIAAICGFREFVNYEGQAAIEFEQAIDENCTDLYNFTIKKNNIIDWEPMIKEMIEDIHQQIPISVISAKFHLGLVNIFVQLLEKIRQEHQINKIVLSGGVFMNLFLLKNLEFQLLNHNFEVYTHKKVPANDGGIALGQLFIADHFYKNSKIS